MSTNPMIPTSPFLGPWLAGLGTMSTDWAALWNGDLARRQVEMMTAFQRQAMRFWTAPWWLAPAQAAQPAAPTVSTATAPAAFAPPSLPAPVVPVVETEAEAEARPAPVAAVEPEAPAEPQPAAGIVAAKLPKRAKPAAPL
ncbi:hypothetical protein, partial [Falsiroseomonas oryzae]